jgi:endoglucanase
MNFKRYASALLFSNLLICLILAGGQVVGQSSRVYTGKIPIEGSRWYQINNAYYGIEGLFDGQLNSTIQVGWGLQFSNWEAWYALSPNESITIEQIKFFDWQGVADNKPFLLYALDSLLNRTLIATFTGSTYNRWVGPNPNQVNQFQLPKAVGGFRYLVINTWGHFPAEMELYGTYTKPVPQMPTFTYAPLRNFTGVNGFEWNVLGTLDPSTVDTTKLRLASHFADFRHYIDWQRLEMNEQKYTYNPLHAGGWYLDRMYKAMKNSQIEVLGCLQHIPQWLVNTYPADLQANENSPLRYGLSRLSPASYIEHAKMGFQYAARYGRNNGIDSALVKVNSQRRWTGDGVNVPYQGLNLVKYIECNNEADKWWRGRNAYQTAFEYAANLSAFYDGHLHTLGNDVGVKTADSTMLVVMTGIALARPDYLRGMVDWCKQNRGYKPDGSVNLCWDVVNFHYYSNDGQVSQSGAPKAGAAPEATLAESVAEQFIRVSQQVGQSLPVWITETGYDINPLGSTQFAKAIGAKSAAETQADWILRTSLVYARSGIQKVYYYGLYDNASYGQYGTSGLVDGSKMQPRPAANFLKQLKDRFGRFQYHSTLNSSPNIDKYYVGDTSQCMYAVWMPTDAAREQTISWYVGNTDSVTILTPQPYKTTMDSASIFATDGYIHLVATETPQFVVPHFSPLQLKKMSVWAWSAHTGKLQWEVTTDSLVRYFVIQRKLPGDAFFSTIATVQVADSVRKHVFEWYDVLAVNGINEYRLLVVTTNQQQFLSPIKTVRIGNVKVYPNPVNDWLHIDGLLDAQPNYLKLVALNGKIVASATTTKTRFDWQLSNVPNGLYRLMVMTDNGLVRSASVLKQ